MIVLAASSTPSDVSVRDVASAMREAHKRLFMVEGGFRVEYRVDNDEANPLQPHFVFPKRCDCLLAVRWPKLRVRSEGEMLLQTVQPDGRVAPELVRGVREGDYDFEHGVGAGREGMMLVQLTNFRHTNTASNGFLLRAQGISLMDQRYRSDGQYTTEYFLPEALELGKYRIVGRESVDGTSAIHLEYPGRDSLWLAPDLGWTVLRREVRSAATGDVQETLTAQAVRPIAQGCFLPFEQTVSFFDSAGGRRKHTLTIRVRSVALGVADADLEILIPEGVANYQDMISGTSYQKFADDKAHARTLAQARKDVMLRGTPTATRLIFYSVANVSIFLLGTAAVWRIWNRKRSKPSSNEDAS